MAITITKVRFDGDQRYAKAGSVVDGEFDIAFDNPYAAGGQPADFSTWFSAIDAVEHIPGSSGTGGWPFITAANPNNIVAVSHNKGTAAGGKLMLTVTTTGAELGAVSAVGLSSVRIRVRGPIASNYSA